jgi:imidazole glycerol-phosphate synthase subunit HisF
VVNSIDRDGTMEGYDLGLVEEVRGAVRVPITALGGAGSRNDLGTITRKFGTVGAAAGSIFVFKGRMRAVLINYPDAFEKFSILGLSDGAGPAGIIV